MELSEFWLCLAQTVGSDDEPYSIVYGPCVAIWFQLHFEGFTGLSCSPYTKLITFNLCLRWAKCTTKRHQLYRKSECQYYRLHWWILTFLYSVSKACWPQWYVYIRFITVWFGRMHVRSFRDSHCGRSLSLGITFAHEIRGKTWEQPSIAIVKYRYNAIKSFRQYWQLLYNNVTLFYLLVLKFVKDTFKYSLIDILTDISLAFAYEINAFVQLYQNTLT